MASKSRGPRRLPVTGLTRWSGTAATVGGVLFATAALAQLLFTLRFGGSRFAESLSGIALYHSFNVPAYALFCASLAGFYLRCRSRMRLVEGAGYVAFFLYAGAVIVVPGAALFGWLVSGAPAGVLEPFHEVALPIAIGSLFFGSVLRGLSSIAEAGAPPGASLVLIAAPPIIAGMSVAGAGVWLLLAPKLLLGFGWALLGRGTGPRSCSRLGSSPLST